MAEVTVFSAGATSGVAGIREVGKWSCAERLARDGDGMTGKEAI